MNPIVLHAPQHGAAFGGDADLSHCLRHRAPPAARLAFGQEADTVGEDVAGLKRQRAFLDHRKRGVRLQPGDNAAGGSSSFAHQPKS
jgi:hypothetical protein